MSDALDNQQLDRSLRKKASFWIRFLPRRLTARWRKLPNFLILGTQKGGSTSLYDHIGLHPDVAVSPRKEINYFSNEHQRGEYWYRMFFPFKSSSLTFCGEASPAYIINPYAAGRIRELIPDCRLIVLLRNPAERAISHYYHSFKKGRETLPLMDALQQESTRIDDEWATILRDKNYSSRTHNVYSYCQRGKYADQLQRYFEHFERDQILIIDSDDFFSQPQKTMRLVFNFVGVNQPDEAYFEQLKPRNVNSLKKDVDVAAYRYLLDYYRTPNQELYRITGVNYNWESKIEALIEKHADTSAEE
ncbi:MAG: sulfotransferase domain-containing protein [Oceanicoccus sp.]